MNGSQWDIHVGFSNSYHVLVCTCAYDFKMTAVCLRYEVLERKHCCSRNRLQVSCMMVYNSMPQFPPLCGLNTKYFERGVTLFLWQTVPAIFSPMQGMKYNNCTGRCTRKWKHKQSLQDIRRLDVEVTYSAGIWLGRNTRALRQRWARTSL